MVRNILGYFSIILVAALVGCGGGGHARTPLVPVPPMPAYVRPAPMRNTMPVRTRPQQVIVHHVYHNIQPVRNIRRYVRPNYSRRSYRSYSSRGRR